MREAEWPLAAHIDHDLATGHRDPLRAFGKLRP
jgi:hypothetical protein